ncbi:MAG TPA: dipeptide ABC transporter permease DppC, partial [Paracoccus sp. (in: a-proteobacteria)]|nr:dipeptide ABC transporter permease DppC [Paracoccus sp. (in: a-proteobacteria)]
MTDTTVKISDAAIRRQMLKEFWFYFSQNRGAVIGLAVFILLVVTAIFAPLLAPHDPTQQYRDALLAPPFWQEGGSTKFLLGTDAVGRDMLSRLIYGAQYSLFIGIVVVAIALVGGVVIGLVAGFYGGWVD